RVIGQSRSEAIDSGIVTKDQRFKASAFVYCRRFWSLFNFCCCSRARGASPRPVGGLSSVSSSYRNGRRECGQSQQSRMKLIAIYREIYASSCHCGPPLLCPQSLPQAVARPARTTAFRRILISAVSSRGRHACFRTLRNAACVNKAASRGSSTNREAKL